MKLSVCLIVKNEQAVLARCLACAQKFADEIVVADTGSADETAAIARAFTPHVFSFAWRDDFSAARNYAFSCAHGDYLMWLDADDVIEDGEAEKIVALKARLASADTFMLRYRSGGLFYYRERIVRNCENAVWQGRVHEAIVPFGRISYEDITITHCKENKGMGTRNLDIYRKMQAEGAPFSARDEFYFARELFYHAAYGEAAARFEEFLARPDGWAENKISASEHLADCYLALGEKKRAKRTLLNGLLFAPPRAELLCKLGGLAAEEGDWRRAVFYYRTCLLCERDETSGGFFTPDCYGFLPYIGLCVCYFRLGDEKKAEEYNALAGKCKPDDPAYLYNVRYFRSLHAGKKE